MSKHTTSKEKALDILTYAALDCSLHEKQAFLKLLHAIKYLMRNEQ